MKNSWILFLLTQLFIVSSSFGDINSCNNNLEPELKHLIVSKNDAFAELYYISLLKLTLAIAPDEHQKHILKNRIKVAIKDVEALGLGKFANLVKDNYGKYAKTMTRKHAQELLEDKSSIADEVVSSYLLSQSPDCLEHCLSDEDESIFWLEKQLTQGHSSNLFSKLLINKRPKIYLNGEEGDEAARKLKEEIKSHFAKYISNFNIRQQLCGGVSEQQNCSPFQVKSNLDGQVEEVFGLLSEGAYSLDLNKEQRGKVLKKIRSDLNMSADKEGADETHFEWNNTKRMCGPVEFTPSLTNKSIYGFSDPRGSIKGAGDAINTYKKSGIEGLKKLSNDNSSYKSSGKSKFNGASLLSKFQIPGPMFRCEPESPIAVPKFGFLSADKTVCCDEEVESRKVRFYFINWGGGFSCRAFFGLPYIAEVGAKLGVGLNVLLSGGVEPEQCLEKTCIKASPMFNVSASLYAEVLSGVGSIQGTISWLPYASIQQCINQSDTLPPADINYQVGRVLAIVSVRMGWAFSYNDIKPIYESNKNTHTSFPIF